MNMTLASTVIPLAEWVDSAVDWMIPHWRPFFQDVQAPLRWTYNQINDGMTALPELAALGILVALAWRLANWKVALFTLVSMGLLGGWDPLLPHLDIWEETMTTLALIVTSVLVCVILGVPLGIAASRSDKFEAVLRPVLDVMQTTPSFVYLIPVVALISLGAISGIVATVAFAIAPIVRLTNLGIRQVDHEVIEAAQSFGATSRQVLFDVQVPLALRTIMAGLNQTLMLALSMVVIASIIGGPGLGQLVRRGINNFDPGIGAVGGIGIVVLAIVLDRMTQALAQPSGVTQPGGQGEQQGLVSTVRRILGIPQRSRQPAT